jgi:hypothetical protein
MMWRPRPTPYLQRLYARVEARERQVSLGRAEARAIAQRTKTARMFNGLGGGGTEMAKENAITTPEAATARLAELQRDGGFRDRLFRNEANAKQEWADLVRTAAGHAPTSTVGSAQTQAKARMAALMNDNEWQKRCLAGDIEAKREYEGLIRTLAAEEPEGEAP